MMEKDQNIKSLKDTYDLVHTNPTGSEKIARFIFKEIQSKINY